MKIEFVTIWDILQLPELPDEGGGEAERGQDRPHELCLQRASLEEDHRRVHREGGRGGAEGIPGRAWLTVKLKLAIVLLEDTEEEWLNNQLSYPICGLLISQLQPASVEQWTEILKDPL